MTDSNALLAAVQMIREGQRMQAQGAAMLATVTDGDMATGFGSLGGVLAAPAPALPSPNVPPAALPASGHSGGNGHAPAAAPAAPLPPERQPDLPFEPMGEAEAAEALAEVQTPEPEPEPEPEPPKRGKYGSFKVSKVIEYLLEQPPGVSFTTHELISMLGINGRGFGIILAKLVQVKALTMKGTPPAATYKVKAATLRGYARTLEASQPTPRNFSDGRSPVPRKVAPLDQRKPAPMITALVKHYLNGRSAKGCTREDVANDSGIPDMALRRIMGDLVHHGALTITGFPPNVEHTVVPAKMAEYAKLRGISSEPVGKVPHNTNAEKLDAQGAHMNRVTELMLNNYRGKKFTIGAFAEALGVGGRTLMGAFNTLAAKGALKRHKAGGATTWTVNVGAMNNYRKRFKK